MQTVKPPWIYLWLGYSSAHNDNNNEIGHATFETQGERLSHNSQSARHFHSFLWFQGNQNGKGGRAIISLLHSGWNERFVCPNLGRILRPTQRWILLVSHRLFPISATKVYLFRTNNLARLGQFSILIVISVLILAFFMASPRFFCE